MSGGFRMGLHKPRHQQGDAMLRRNLGQFSKQAAHVLAAANAWLMEKGCGDGNMHMGIILEDGRQHSAISRQLLRVDRSTSYVYNV